MKLIVGLGNPGAQYERTRHNAGFMVVDRLVDRHAKGEIPRAKFNSLVVETRLPTPPGGSDDGRCLLMKPTTYMNRSGQAVGDAVRFYKLNPALDILVLVDDIYLPSGTIRLREDGSAAGHNGLFDLERVLGGDKYCRCRIGIDEPGIIPQADYVLGRITEDQWPKVTAAVEKAADAAETWFSRGMTAAMNKFNVKPPKPAVTEKEPRS